MSHRTNDFLPVCVGFGRGILNDVLPADRPVREDIEVHALYLGQGPRACCWIVLDFMDFDRQTVDGIKGAVSNACRLPLEHVHVLTTHNHGAGNAEPGQIDRFAREATAAVGAAMAAAVPASMRYACVTVPEQVSVIRRLHVEELGGMTTFFFGPCAANGYDCSDFLKHQLYQLREKRDVCYSGTSDAASRAIRTLHPGTKTRLAAGDSRLAILYFETGKGVPIGSLCRFAAHAVCCNRPEHYSSDYPYHVRKTLADTLGGAAVFMNGPCGDIAPAILDKYSQGERLIGTRLGELAAQAVVAVRPEALHLMEDQSREVLLPVRDDLTDTEPPMPGTGGVPDVCVDDKNLPLPELKKLAEQVRLVRCGHFLRAKWRNAEPEDHIRQRQVAVRLGLLTLNDVHIVAFPGETFSTTAEQVRIESGSDRVVTVTEHDRTVMYLVPPADYHLGGYETTCCLTAPGAEPLLARQALAMIDHKRCNGA